MNHSEKRHRPNQRRGQRMHGRRGQRRGWRTLRGGQLLDLKHQLERSAGFRGRLDALRRQTRIYASLGGRLFSRIGNAADGRRAPGASQPIRADTAEMSQTMFCNPTIFWIMRTNEFVQSSWCMCTLSHQIITSIIAN